MPFKYNPIEGIFDIVVTNTAGGASTSFSTDSGTATPASGVITVAGGSLITTSGSGSTVTVAATGAVPSSFPTDSGTATVSGNQLQIIGGGSISTSGSGNVVTVSANFVPYPKIYHFASEGLGALETNFPPLSKLTGTNVKVFVRAYDDSTEEYANGKIWVPGDIDSSGTVNFRAYVSAATAAASKNIGLTFGHLALNNDEDWDPASPYTDEDSGAVAISATQDNVTLVEWSETVSNLGWTANDMVLFRISRDVGVANDLTGDMYLFDLEIEVPRS